jgi:ankyrin repeat protein
VRDGLSPTVTRTGKAVMQGKNPSLGFSLLAAVMLMACASNAPRTASRDIALIRAAEKGQTKEMFRLIKAGADINAQDAEGWTPYLAASSMGQLEAMRMLRAFGAKTAAPEMNLDNTAYRQMLR